MDLISCLIILLRGLITVLILVSSIRANLLIKEFQFYSAIILIFLVLAFRIQDFIGFYIFFESVLIPISIIIFKWGNQPERIQAGKYILLYTLFGSLPLLIVLLLLSSYSSLS